MPLCYCVVLHHHCTCAAHTHSKKAPKATKETQNHLSHLPLRFEYSLWRALVLSRSLSHRRGGRPLRARVQRGVGEEERIIAVGHPSRCDAHRRVFSEAIRPAAVLSSHHLCGPPSTARVADVLSMQQVVGQNDGPGGIGKVVVYLSLPQTARHSTEGCQKRR